MITGKKISFTDDELEVEFYKEFIDKYYKLKMELKWEMRDGNKIKLKDMKDLHIKNCINMLTKLPTNYQRKGWVFIFNDVLLRRRTLKINKIKNRIYESTKIV